MKKILFLMPVIFAMFSLALVACGGGGDDEGGGSAAGSQSTAAPSPPASATVQEVTVTAIESGEAYSFNVSRTALRVGKVRLTLINQPGQERPHTFFVKALDGNTDLAMTGMVQPGTQAVLEFDLTAPGTYNFLCNLRGHADRGQKGTFTVTQ